MLFLLNLNSHLQMTFVLLLTLASFIIKLLKSLNFKNQYLKALLNLKLIKQQTQKQIKCLIQQEPKQSYIPIQIVFQLL